MSVYKISLITLITSLYACQPAFAQYDSYSQSIQQQNYEMQQQAEMDNQRNDQIREQQQEQQNIQQQQDEINRINAQSPAQRMGGCC